MRPPGGHFHQTRPARAPHLAARRAQRAVRRDGDRVDIAGVAVQVVLELTVGKVPHLHLSLTK